MKTVALLLLGAFALPGVARAEIKRIWLSHRSNDPSALVVNWETDQPGDSLLEYGIAPDQLARLHAKDHTTLHHLEVTLGLPGDRWYYRVSTGRESSAMHSFQAYTGAELRVAVVADTGFAQADWARAVLAQKPHLLVSAGDHIPSLHSGQPVPADTTAAFSKLVDRFPEIFQSTPWLPLLGNHDREMRPRGPTPPAEPVYDLEATAFCKFFDLPEPEWHWHFDLPEFGARLIAADLSHLGDQGTTWQTCHTPTEQLAPFRALMEASPQPFVVTLYNERNATVRALEKGGWGEVIQRGSLAITGFGYFGERAEVDGFSYYNTAVKGTGAKYADPKSAYFASEDNFILMTFRRAPAALRVELRSLAGQVLEARDFTPRS